MEFFIRRATIDDREPIIAFNARLAEETESKVLDPDLLRAGVEGVLSEPARGTYYVAVAGSRVVGQLLITYEWSDWRNGTFWWIQSVYVEKDWRTKGVFTSLYDHVLKRAQATEGVCGLRLYVEHSNDRAQRTYLKLGMQETGYRLFEADFTAKGRP